MDKKSRKYYLKIITFINKLCFFDKNFINYMEDKIEFIGKSNYNQNEYLLNFKHDKKDNINLILPYPNNHVNFLLCLDVFCEAYVYYLIRRNLILDNNYLETLKASIKRVYIEENFKASTIQLYNKEQLKSLKELNNEQIIGLALSFEISNAYITTGCFLIPDEYFFDGDKALEYAEIELNYRLDN